MSSRTALSTPTDVSPNNGDCINFNTWGNFSNRYTWYAPFTFTNQCDVLTFVTKDIYDATTDEFIGRYYLVNGMLQDGQYYLKYTKGDTFRVWTPKDDNFISGRHYKYKITCYTHHVDNVAHNLGEPNCCVPYASGKILKVAPSRTRIVIQPDISKLRDPYYWHEGEDDEQLVGCTYMRIGNEERMVIHYNKNTGEVTLKNAFSEEAIPETGNIDENGVELQYYLNCNYIEDGWYDFYYREDIESSVFAAPTYAGLRCKASYFHPNNVGLEKYRFKIYSKNGDSYQNGEVQNADDIGTVDLRHIAIEKNIGTNLVGKNIVFAKEKSDAADFETGYLRTVLAYNSGTGIVTLNGNLNKMPEEGTRYRVYMGEETLIADSGDLNSYDLAAEFALFTPGEKLDIVCDMTTYEKQTNTESISLTVSAPIMSCPIYKVDPETDDVDQRVILEYTANKTFSGKTLKLYRRSKDQLTWKIVAASRGNSLPLQGGIIDYTAGNNAEYEYILLYSTNESTNLSNYDANDLPIYIPSDNYAPSDIVKVKTEWDGWTISSLIETEKNDASQLTKYTEQSILTSGRDIPLGDSKLKNQYYVGETWRFISDINSGDITKNLGITLHTGTSTYPAATRSNNAYTSGTFSANLLTLECPSGEIRDDIDKVRRWDRFINGDNLFMLKSDKGDVWIVQISENTSRTYDESTSLVLTNVSYSWVEAMSLDDILII